MSTADDIREAEQANAAVLLLTSLKSLAAAVEDLEKDPTLAAEGMTTQQLADASAAVIDARKRLGNVERDLVTVAGRREGKVTLDLSDGRQAKLERSADRKEWQHDDWQRDVRRVVVGALLESQGLPKRVVIVNPETGEEQEHDLAVMLHQVVMAAQVVHGSQAPKSTMLKPLGLYATDYCTSTPGGWRMSVITPDATPSTKDTKETTPDA